MYRSNFAMAARFITEMVVFLFCKPHYSRTKEYLGDGGPPKESDFAEDIVNFAKVMTLALVFLRGLFLAVSFKRLSICKTYYYFEFLVFLV